MMKLNPDKDERKRIAQEVKDNEGYCPCMIHKTENTKCPCIWKREEEICVCGLYVKVEEEKEND